MATDYYISPFGNDNNNGQSINSPFKTFYHSAAILRDDDVLYVLPGLFSGSENSIVTFSYDIHIEGIQGADQTIVVGPGQWKIRSTTFSIYGVQFTKFTTSSTFDLYGYSYPLTFKLFNSTFYDNDNVITVSDSDIYIEIYHANFTSNSLAIAHNINENYNGGIAFVNSTIANGNGGIFGYFDDIYIYNSTFSNQNCDYSGCAISILQCDQISINASRFEDNISTLDGGAILIKATTSGSSIVNSLFQSNSSPGNGGAIFVSATTEQTVISNSTFLLNTAQNGGAIYSFDSLEISSSKFYSNSADLVGGAIYLEGSTTISVGATVAQTEFENNSGDTSAGAVYCTNSVVSYQFVDFTNNSAPLGSSYQCGDGCSTYSFSVTSTGNSPSCGSDAPPSFF